MRKALTSLILASSLAFSGCDNTKDNLVKHERYALINLSKDLSGIRPGMIVDIDGDNNPDIIVEQHQNDPHFHVLFKKSSDYSVNRPLYLENNAKPWDHEIRLKVINVWNNQYGLSTLLNSK